eukprot:g963.t1
MNRSLHRLGRKYLNKKKFDTPFKKWNIKKGDTVQVIGPLSGKDIGKTGVVKAVLRKKNRVIVEGLNLRRRNIRASDEIAGGVHSVESPIHVSHVSMVCPETGQLTGVQRRWLEDGTKVRVAKVSGALIPEPEWERTSPRPEGGFSDTAPEAVLRKTFEEVTLENGSLLFHLEEERNENIPHRLKSRKST